MHVRARFAAPAVSSELGTWSATRSKSAVTSRNRNGESAMTNMKSLRVVLLGAVAVLWSGMAAAQIASATAKGGFDEVKDNLVLAI